MPEDLQRSQSKTREFLAGGFGLLVLWTANSLTAAVGKHDHALRRSTFVVCAAGRLWEFPQRQEELRGVRGDGGTLEPQPCPPGRASLLASASQKLETSVKGLQGKMGQSVVEMSEKLKQMQSTLMKLPFSPQTP